MERRSLVGCPEPPAISHSTVVPLQLAMLDHIVIARRRAVSIRETGLIPGMLWTVSAPGSRIMREWLDADLLYE